MVRASALRSDPSAPREVPRRCSAAFPAGVAVGRAWPRRAPHLVAPGRERTTDQQIAGLADQDGWVVVTKDESFQYFRNSHLLTGSPARLLVVATGNIGNDDLLPLRVAPGRDQDNLASRSQRRTAGHTVRQLA